MAEPIKNHKVSLRNIMEEIAEDESFSDEERHLANKKMMELDYQEWCKRQLKSGKGSSL